MKVHVSFKNVRKISETEYELEVDLTTTVSFKIKREVLQIVEDLAKRKGKTTSDVIREALKEEIDEIKNLGSGRVVSFRIKENQLRDIDELARQYNVTRTDIIHSKLAKYLEKEGITIG
jgi:predicted transcriptional regulator